MCIVNSKYVIIWQMFIFKCCTAGLLHFCKLGINVRHLPLDVGRGFSSSLVPTIRIGRTSSISLPPSHLVNIGQSQASL